MDEFGALQLRLQFNVQYEKCLSRRLSGHW